VGRTPPVNRNSGSGKTPSNRGRAFPIVTMLDDRALS
jgi:hypothetical protein